MQSRITEYRHKLCLDLYPEKFIKSVPDFGDDSDFKIFPF